MSWGAVHPSSVNPEHWEQICSVAAAHREQAEALARAEHDAGMCWDDCKICEDQAYAMNAQYDCAHKSYTQVQAWVGAKPYRAWCDDCGKDLLK